MKIKRYDEDFKKKLVKVYNQGNYSYRSLSSEYGVSVPTIRTWVLRYNTSNSFEIEGNLTDEDKEVINLKERVKQLEAENDILKKAALLLGKK